MHETIIDGTWLNEGEVVYLSLKGEMENFGRQGDIASIHGIYEANYNDDLPRIAVVRQGCHDRWGSLDDEVDSGTGLVFRATNFLKYFDIKQTRVKVLKHTTPAGVKMDGRRGTLLAYMSDGEHCFVEFDENIGGGSADGLGKDGHCLLLRHDAIKRVSKRGEKWQKRKSG